MPGFGADLAHFSGDFDGRFVLKRVDFVELLLLAALWGASFMFTRSAVPQFGPFALMGLRAVIGAAVLLPFVLRAGGGPQMRAHAGPIAWVGLLNSALPYVLFGYALQHLSAGFSSILNATTPLWGAIIAYVGLGERLGPFRWLGLVISFCGVVVLVWGRVSFAGDGLGLPILAALLACVSYAASSSETRRKLAGVSPMAGAAGSQFVGALILLPFAVAWWPEQTPDPWAWFNAALLGVLATGVALLLFFRLNARLGSTRAISVTFLVPVFGVLWGALLLGESVTLRMLVGAATILAGTALITGVVDPRRWFVSAAATPDVPADSDTRR